MKLDVDFLRLVAPLAGIIVIIILVLFTTREKKKKQFKK